MLPDAPRLSSNTAAAWISPRVPDAVHRLALPLAWLLAVLVASPGAHARSCAAVCGPDRGSAILLAVCLATPVLLLLRWTVAGCLAGIIYGVVEVVIAPVPEGRVVWGLYGLLCAGTLAWVLGTRRAQRAAVREGSVTLPAARGRTSWVMPLAAAALIVVAAGFFVSYGVAVAAERAHVDRAVTANLRVTAQDVQGRALTLTGDDGRVHRITRVTVAPYPVGSVVPVLLDPRDDSWSRVAARPLDLDALLTAGSAFALAGGLLAGRLLLRRRARRGLLTGAHPALLARIRFVAGEARIAPLDADEELVVARVPVDVPAGLATDGLSYAGLVAGDLSGWAAVVVDDRTLLPRGPIRLEKPWWETVRAPVYWLLPAVAIFVVSLLAGIVAPVAEDLATAAAVAGAGAFGCWLAARFGFHGVRFEAQELEVRRGLWTHRVPVGRLSEVSILPADSKLILTWPGHRPVALEPLAASMNDLGMLIARASDRADPELQGIVRRAPAPVLHALGAYAVIVLAAFAAFHL